MEFRRTNMQSAEFNLQQAICRYQLTSGFVEIAVGVLKNTILLVIVTSKNISVNILYMYLKKLRASTNPRLRSLLQKAVRRGAGDIVQATISNIITLGDRAWLRSRAVVITFEESWPLAQSLALTKDQQTKETALLRVSHATKQKDAAGLGALAFAYHEGDRSMLDIVLSKHALQIVAEGLDRPKDYFEWALSQCSSEESHCVVMAARDYIAAATWGWDKATILAAAFLATSGVPTLLPAKSTVSDFPYWVALDKHTPEGKEAFRRVGIKCRVAYRQLIWAGFYCESTVVNALEPSAWFDVERFWRLRKAGLNPENAERLWIRLRPVIRNELETTAADLRLQIESQKNVQMDMLK